MRIIEWIGIGVLILVCLLGLLFVRREIISRGGSIELCLRVTTLVPGRGWSPGIARFAGDELRWYRVFSFAPKPRKTLSRRVLQVRGRRAPDTVERLVLPANWVVLTCDSDRGAVEIAMAESTVTGFLSWLESAPPGPVSFRFAAG